MTEVEEVKEILSSENPFKFNKAENFTMGIKNKELRYELFRYISTVELLEKNKDITDFKELNLYNMREVSVDDIGSFEKLLYICGVNGVKVSEDLLDIDHNGNTVGKNMFLVLKEKELMYEEMVY